MIQTEVKCVDVDINSQDPTLAMLIAEQKEEKTRKVNAFIMYMLTLDCQTFVVVICLILLMFSSLDKKSCFLWTFIICLLIDINLKLFYSYRFKKAGVKTHKDKIRFIIELISLAKDLFSTIFIVGFVQPSLSS